MHYVQFNSSRIFLFFNLEYTVKHIFFFFFFLHQQGSPGVMHWSRVISPSLIIILTTRRERSPSGQSKRTGCSNSWGSLHPLWSAPTQFKETGKQLNTCWGCLWLRKSPHWTQRHHSWCQCPFLQLPEKRSWRKAGWITLYSSNTQLADGMMLAMTRSVRAPCRLLWSTFGLTHNWPPNPEAVSVSLTGCGHKSRPRIPNSVPLSLSELETMLPWVPQLSNSFCQLLGDNVGC